jgi:hypothetical protein
LKAGGEEELPWNYPHSRDNHFGVQESFCDEASNHSVPFFFEASRA